MGVRLIVQIEEGERSRFRDDEKYLLDAGFRVYEIDNDAFEELLRDKVKMRLVGVEVYKSLPKAPVQPAVAAPAPQPITIEVKAPAPAPAPAIAPQPVAALLPPPPATSGMAVLKARLAARKGVAWWKKPLIWIGLMKTPVLQKPATNGSGARLPLP